MAEIMESKNFIHAFIDEDIAEGGRYAGQTFSSSDKASGHCGHVQGTPTVVSLLWLHH